MEWSELQMREANHTRIFVKFFVDDGSPLQMLIDERWSVVEVSGDDGEGVIMGQIS